MYQNVKQESWQNVQSKNAHQAFPPSIHCQENASGVNMTKNIAAFFCNKFYAKMARHLEQSHKNESEVASILCLSKKSKSRKAKFVHIMKKGDFCHNKEVYVTKQGSLIPCLVHVLSFLG